MKQISQDPVTIDSIFKELGPFGRYNIINYALLLFPCYLAGMYGSAFNFEALDISYRYEISKCEKLNNKLWLEQAIPMEKCDLSTCSMYQYNNNSNELCTKEAFNTSVITECDAYVYSDVDSVVKGFNLGCQNWKRTLVGTIHNDGLFVSLSLTGVISDRFGRKIALPLASLMNGICGMTRLFSTSYTMLLIFEFGESALGDGAYSTFFILEVFPTNVRHSLLAVCSATEKVESTLAPLTPLLKSNSTMQTSQDPVTIDSIFKELGPFGRYNIVNYALLVFPCYFGAMYSSVYNFEALDITYRCEISKCEKLNNTLWLEHAIPTEKGDLSKCSMYQHSDSSDEAICTQEAFNHSMVLECDEYVYSDEDSVVKDFDLACQNWKRTLIGTMHNAGFFVSLPLTGMLSDKFGRRIALPIAALMNGICGIIRSFSTSYMMMLILEFGESALGGGAYSTSFVLAMELVGPNGRVFGNATINFLYVLGLTTVAGLAWWLQNWRYLLRIIYTPMILVLSYFFILNESPRWLFSKGRYEEGIDILKKAATMNKVVILEEKLNPINFVKNKEESTEKHMNDEKKRSVFSTVIKSKTITLRLVICSYMWITCSFVYYGLSINSVSLAGNRYLNFILVALVEIPANIICLLALDNFGRKRVILINYILSGCLCISLSVIPKDYIWGTLFLYLCGKCSITIAYISVYIYVSELIPTTVRQSLLAVCSTVGRIGSTLAPLTPLLALYYVNLPEIFFGCLPLIASLLVYTLPETINAELPDTVEEAEKISRKKKKVVV